MNPELVQYLTGAGVAALVGAVWRLGNQVSRQNGNVANLMQQFAEHRVEDRQNHLYVMGRLDQRHRGWFRRD